VCTTNGKTIAGTVRRNHSANTVAVSENAKIVAKATVCTTKGKENAKTVR